MSKFCLVTEKRSASLGGEVHHYHTKLMINEARIGGSDVDYGGYTKK